MSNDKVFDERHDIDWLDQIICGDAWRTVQNLPSAVAQTVVTSPPYFGHRKYTQGAPALTGEFGRESTPLEYVSNLVELFERIKRILRPSATIWLNLGDTYRDGQLLGIPWRSACALQDAGWLLRSEVIWNKTNAMPSPVKNRPTVSHEHIFLFALQRDYYYDADAIREPHVTFTSESKMRGGRNHFGKMNGTPESGKNGGNPNLHKGRWDQAFHPLGRNKRTVWDMPLGKYRDAHFAVFPEWLVETCVRATTREGDIVLDPFMGSGTTAVVSRRLQRHFIGLELVREYALLSQQRLERTGVNLTLPFA